jgi:hypothetical protein
MREGGRETWFFFDERESGLVELALAAIGQEDFARRERLWTKLELLGGLASLVQKSPAIAQGWESEDGVPFSGEPLVDLLCRLPDYDIDLHLPPKAVLGQSFLVLKIKFFHALASALSASRREDLRERVEREEAQSIYSKLGEELFLAIVTDPRGDPRVKAAAARFLFRIWEGRLLIEIDDFAPILESVWSARDKFGPVLGTLAGTQETLQLVRDREGERFLDYFCAPGVSEDEVHAFEEFLFAISHEEILQLRQHLEKGGPGVVSLDDARELLGRRSSWAPQRTGAQSLYSNHKKRRVNALHRTLTGAPGPKKTVEEYVMISFLRGGIAP